MSRSYNSRGFTLIEIVVAMTILALALGALLQIFGSGLRGSAVADDRATALLLAQSKLAEVGTARPVEPILDGGTFDDRYEWTIEITETEPDADAGPEDLGAPALFAVTVTVEWAGGRRFALSTLRLESSQ